MGTLHRERAAIWRHRLVPVAIASIVLLCRLGATRLWDQDEPRNAGCAIEMLARGDWVTPVFNDQLRGHKPVLLYWIMMGATAVLGSGELAARIGSAFCAVGTVLCTFEIGRRLFDVRTASWAGVMLTSSLMFVVAGRAATPDALLIFCCTLAILAFVICVWPNPTRRRPHEDARGGSGWFKTPLSRRQAAAVYAAMALAVLAKGPVGLVLPAAVIALYLWAASLVTRSPLVTKQYGWRRVAVGETNRALQVVWSMRPFTAFVVILAVAGPWYAWVGWRTEGQWLREFFIEHNWNRARAPMEGHRGPVFYYLVAILPGFFPWSIFIVPTCLDAWRRWRRRDAAAGAITLCFCWLAVWIGAFSLAGTKLPSYVTPCYPALALLTSHYLVRWMAGQTLADGRWPWCSLACLGAAGLAMLIALPYAAARFVPGESILGLLGAVLVLTAAAAALWALWHKRRLAAATVALGSCAWLVLLFAWAAPRVDRHQQADRLLAAIHRRDASLPVVCYGALQPSWVYYLGRPIQEFPATSASSAGQGRLVDYLEHHPESLVITTGAEYQRLRDVFRNAATAGGSRLNVLADVAYFLRDERLVLLQLQPSAMSEATLARKPQSAISGRH